jgi:hypothetical protein
MAQRPDHILSISVKSFSNCEIRENGDISSEMGRPESIILVGFEVLTAVSTKMAVFWVAAPCSLVEVWKKVNFYQNTRRNNPEDSHLQLLYVR